MAWKKLGLTPDEENRLKHADNERRNIESTYRGSSRTGNRKRRPSPCQVTVMPGYSLEEALKGTGGDADE